MEDPVLRIARKRAERLVEDSAAIEVEFESFREWRPVLSILKRLRDQAAEALTALAFTDPEDPKEIRRQQNQVQLFSDFVAIAKQIYHGGIEAGEILDAEAKEEMRDLIDAPEDRVENEAVKDHPYDD